MKSANDKEEDTELSSGCYMKLSQLGIPMKMYTKSLNKRFNFMAEKNIKHDIRSTFVCFFSFFTNNFEFFYKCYYI